jgi:two-component system chemotaxis response regulator CheY
VPGVRILVVEDAEVVRVMAAMVLERAGHTVLQALDGQDGLEQAQGAPLDLVITDQAMPRMDGLTLARTLRALPLHARTPILMITAESDAAFGHQVAAAGIDRLLHKPVGARTLTSTVADLLAERTAGLASA